MHYSFGDAEKKIKKFSPERTKRTKIKWTYELM